MMLHKALLVPALHGLILLVLVAAATAQNEGPAAAAPVNQGTAPLLFANEAPRSNLLTMGLSASTSYDDNTLGTTPAVGAVVSIFSTPLTLNVARSSWSANLRYAPQYTYSADITAYNSVSHIAGGTLEFRPSRRLTVALRESYTHTTTPMEIQFASQATPVFGVSNQLNPTGYGAYLAISTEQAGADFSYALGPHSSFGFGGGYSSVQSFQPNNANLYLQDFTAWSGHAFYSRQVSRHQTLGVQFQWQRIDSMGGMSQATPISVQYFHQIQLSRGFNFSLFGGPQLTDTSDVIPASFLLTGVPFGTPLPSSGPLVTLQNRQWGASGGGTVSWNSRHNAAALSVVRQVTGGGAFAGVANSLIFTGSYRRQLTRSVALNLFGNYTYNNSLDTLTQVPVGSYASATAQLTRMLGSRAQFGVSYTRLQAGSLAPGAQQLLLSGNHNQVMVSLSYQFERALGK